MEVPFQVDKSIKFTIYYTFLTSGGGVDKV